MYGKVQENPDREEPKSMLVGRGSTLMNTVSDAGRRTKPSRGRWIMDTACKFHVEITEHGIAFSWKTGVFAFYLPRMCLIPEGWRIVGKLLLLQEAKRVWAFVLGRLENCLGNTTAAILYVWLEYSENRRFCETVTPIILTVHL